MQWFSVEAHLERARMHLTAPMPEAVFYAALEFRYAVESRLLDFSDAAEHLKKNNVGSYTATGLTKHLNKTYRPYAPVPSTYIVEIHSPKLEAPFVLKYVPITPAVVSILGKVDNYLHAAGLLHCRDAAVVQKLKDLLWRGIALVEKSMEGGMNGPMVNIGNGQAHFSVCAEKHPELAGAFSEGAFTPGEHFLLNVIIEPLPPEEEIESPSKGLV